MRDAAQRTTHRARLGEVLVNQAHADVEATAERRATLSARNDPAVTAQGAIDAQLVQLRVDILHALLAVVHQLRGAGRAVRRVSAP